MQPQFSGMLQPHRGQTIVVLGIIGITLSLMGLPLAFCGMCCPPLGIVGGLLSLPCSITAIIMSQGDLKKIAEGKMDPEGASQTRAGMVCGFVGAGLGATVTLVAILWNLYYFLVALPEAMQTQRSTFPR